MKAIIEKNGDWVFVDKKLIEVKPQFVAIKMSDIIKLLKYHPARDTFIIALAEKAYLDNGI